MPKSVTPVPASANAAANAEILRAPEVPEISRTAPAGNDAQPSPRGFARLFARLAWVRNYRASRQSPFPWTVRLPFVRNAIRHEAHRSWKGGYLFVPGGHLLYVPAPVDVMSGSHLLKPYRPARIIGVLCKPGDTVIDIGASIGDWTLAAADAVGRQGRVIALEAIPHVAEALAKTVSINRMKWVKVIAAACAESEGRVAFSVEHENTGGSRMGNMENDPGRTFERIEVPAVTLDGVAASEGLSAVDVVKIDVEGREAAVLRGGVVTLRKFKPALFLETGHESDADRQAIAGLCAGIGYRIAGVAAGEGLMEAGWEHYLAREGAFSGGPTDMVLIADAQ